MEAIPLSDEPGEQKTELTTDGDTFKPFVAPLREFVDEIIFEFSDDGIHAFAVDPTNVATIGCTLHASAFDACETADWEAGIPLKSLHGAIRRARMDSADELRLSISENELAARVDREHDSATVTSADIIRLINPGSIRERPDINSDEWDAEMHTVTLGEDAFLDGFGHVAGRYDQTQFTSIDGDFVVGVYNAEEEESQVRYDGMGHDTDASVILSCDYLEDFLTAFNRSKADSVTIEYGDAFPVIFTFSRERDGETIMDGRYIQAPRIES